MKFRLMGLRCGGLVAWLFCQPVFCLPTNADLLPGNVWANSSFELDADHNSVPDGWNRGGNDTTIDGWTTSTSVTGTHSLALIDSNASTYGEWYSDYFSVAPNVLCQLRYNLKYSTTGTMRVSVNFYDASNTSLSSISYTFSGTQTNWQEFTQPFTTPANTAKLRVTFTSGGSSSVTGSAWLDDMSLAIVTPTGGVIPYVHVFPNVPNPLVIRDWKQTATSYHQLAFNPSASGPSLPLLYGYSANTSAGYTGSAFGLPSYVGQTPSGGEALSALGAVLGGTLAGMDMAALNGVDRVRQCEAFYTLVNGHGLVFNNVNSQGAKSAWYDIFPSILFYQIGSRYPNRATFQTKMTAIAESWLTALPVLSNNWEHTGFNFATMTAADLAWHEPDMAVGIAWLEYMAYARTGDARYLAAADTCMSQLNTRTLNPMYEVLGYYGPCLAARMNAELGRSYSIDKHLGWVFASTSNARPGWGCIGGRWGSFDAYGLMGSSTDTSGYAFSMNTYAAAGAIAPLCRYAPKYASDIGRWLLHVAANANLYFPDTLPANMQSSAAYLPVLQSLFFRQASDSQSGINTPASV